MCIRDSWWFVYRRNEIAAPDYSKPEEIIAQTRFPITDADRANLAALAAMCADPASGVTCPAVLPTYTAVSYTHLDVYKRQRWCC